jgi:hydroxyethylthiazole kinase
MNLHEIGTRAAAAHERLRRTGPLVHHITNFVVMNDTANVTLAVGASPVMAHAVDEVEEMTAVAGALVLNPGTLEPDWVQAMLLAGRAARSARRPVILDPVGAGATSYRTRTNRRLIDEVGPSIVRGNAGEIGVLAGAGGAVRGVDSVGELEAPDQVALRAARGWGCCVAITGKRDHVSDGERVIGVENGHPWLTAVTGTGCMATAVTGAFAAVEPDGWLAAVAALGLFGLAAERAAGNAQGPGSFKTALIDALFALVPGELERGIRLVDPTTEG